jgi:putative aldouronate transport system permease protein
MKEIIIRHSLAKHPSNGVIEKRRTLPLLKTIRKYRWLYIMAFPAIAYFFIFHYLPLWNAQIAFKSFKPLLGVWKSPWVGFVNFATFFKSFYFSQLLTNTVIISLMKLILGIPMAIILAVALYETQHKRFQILVQTTVYLPHFLSWVIMLGVLLMMLSPADGLINSVIKSFGGKPIAFLTSPNWFRSVVVFSDIWKETGWATILYLAALMAIDPTLFEAAQVDGASRIQRIWYISLPGILPVIVILTMLRLGHILNAGFNQIFVLYSLPVYSVGDIIDTWVYRSGILDFQLSLATAVGLFKGVMGLILILIAQRVSKKIAGYTLY